jgi:hypothetical protein
MTQHNQSYQADQQPWNSRVLSPLIPPPTLQLFYSSPHLLLLPCSICLIPFSFHNLEQLLVYCLSFYSTMVRRVLKYNKRWVSWLKL